MGPIVNQPTKGTWFFYCYHLGKGVMEANPKWRTLGLYGWTTIVDKWGGWRLMDVGCGWTLMGIDGATEHLFWIVRAQVNRKFLTVQFWSYWGLYTHFTEITWGLPCHHPFPNVSTISFESQFTMAVNHIGYFSVRFPNTYWGLKVKNQSPIVQFPIHPSLSAIGWCDVFDTNVGAILTRNDNPWNP